MRWKPAALITPMRLLLALALLVLAWLGMALAFAAVLAAALAAGAAGHKLPAASGPSRWRARADGWASLATCACIPLGAYWLRPELARGEAVTFWAVTAAIGVPASFAFVKYGAVAGYRARAASIASYALGAAAVVLFAGGPLWPLQLAAAALVLAALEESAMIAVLPRPVSEAQSFPSALRIRRERFADLEE
jgi:CDP-diacylglycerol--glycerol-3-phosphate 3-phosphatidyltransferase